MIKEFLQKQNILAIIVCIALIIIAAATQITSLSFMKSASNEMLAPLNSVDSIQRQIINNSLKGTNLKVATLKKQYLISGEFKNYYKRIGVSYFKNYYAFSICSILFTTLLTIAVFLIANKGWQNSNLIMKSFLLTTILLSSIYYFLPNVLSNKENLRNNMGKVVEFGKIQSDILIISNKIKQMDTIQIDSSITSNYERISTNSDLMTTIDDSKLQNEFTGLIKQLKQNN